MYYKASDVGRLIHNSDTCPVGLKKSLDTINCVKIVTDNVKKQIELDIKIANTVFN